MKINGSPSDTPPLPNDGEVLWLSIIILILIAIIWLGSMQLEYETQRQLSCERVGDQMIWNPDTDLCEVKPLTALKY